MVRLLFRPRRGRCGFTEQPEHPCDPTPTDPDFIPTHGADPTRTLGTATFCNALLDAKQLMMDNFANYQRLGCANPQITLTDDIMISHVYGWTPFIESTKGGTPCGAAANNLENTPTYSNNKYAKYLQVKLEFDSLNYGKYTDATRYAFNPWVMLIHNAPLY
jgi:hypothetical protein